MINTSRVFAFYLPQFHPIPENDEWWGKGFTEWQNVAKSRPRFTGHHQPHVPSDLGFYDLRMLEIHEQQARLASESGIEGFCYYHYWFNGKLLLERPLELVLMNKHIGFPFMLCWANENWSRRWDGKEQEVLIAQDYDEYDVEEHFEYLNRFFSDSRYVTVDGKPVLVLYRANYIPSLSSFINRLDDLARNAGYPGIYVLAVSTTSREDGIALASGVKRIIDFQPSKNHPARKMNLEFVRYISGEVASGRLSVRITKVLPKLEFAKVFSYRKLVDNKVAETANNLYLPCVMPSWDNSARRRTDSTVIQNHDAILFAKWLRYAIEKVSRIPNPERFVFINAWNEWAEGCHLEPDVKNGTVFIDAVKTVLKQ